MGVDLIKANVIKGMPTPKSGQTLICKSKDATTLYSTIHTVTAGKTFYLMGFVGQIDDTSYHWWLSLDGGTTDHFDIRGIKDVTAKIGYQSFFTGWPIAEVAAGVDIKLKSTFTGGDRFTIFGWEE